MFHLTSGSGVHFGFVNSPKEAFVEQINVFLTTDGSTNGLSDLLDAAMLKEVL